MMQCNLLAIPFNFDSAISKLVSEDKTILLGLVVWYYLGPVFLNPRPDLQSAP
jgi:hypothetical protein